MLSLMLDAEPDAEPEPVDAEPEPSSLAGCWWMLAGLDAGLAGPASERCGASRPALTLGHGAVLRVVVRIVRLERLGREPDVLPVGDVPELAEAEPLALARTARAPQLHGAQHLYAARADAMAIRSDNAMLSVVVELEQHAGADCLANRV